ncbi:sugar-binding protein [Ferruginibacter sp. SUN002]|uniref:sugar-binding protein n=1 Tax=Ferruginibacter sp. SUN002 TaxID=2937789 RepID=UPI003D36B4EA
MRKLSMTALLLTFSLLFTITVVAQKTSTGGGGDWNNAATWSPSGVPAGNETVTIASGSPVTISSSITARTVNTTINAGAQLTVNVAATFQNILVSGTFTASAAITNNGSASSVVSSGGVFEAKAGCTMNNGFTYSSGSTLKLNGVTPSTTIWQTNTSGQAVPANVQVSTSYAAPNNNMQANGMITIDAGQTLSLQQGLVCDGLNGSGLISSTNSPTFTIGGISNGTSTFSGNILATGSIVLTKNGSGTLTLNGTNQILGNINVSGGTLSMANLQGTSTLTVGAGFTFKYTGPTCITSRAIAVNTGCIIDASGTGPITFTANTSGTASMVLTGTGEGVISGIIGTSSTLTKTGVGTWSLLGANTYTGQTIISAGTLIANTLANGGSASSLGNGTTTPAISIGATGVLKYTGTGHSTTRQISLSASGGTIDASGTGLMTLSGGVVGNTFGLVLTGTGSGLFNTAAIGTTTGTVTKNGTGTWTYGFANTYTGLTTVSAGVLQMGVANAINNTSNNVTLSGGTLSSGVGAGFSAQFGTLTVTANSTINVGSGIHTFKFAASNAITWTGNLTVTGWNGTGGSTSTLGGQLWVGTTGSGASGAQLTATSFTGYSGSTTQLSSGEIIPGTGTVRYFYSDPAGGTPTDVNKWWANPAGSGAHPTDFTTATDIFIVQSAMTTTAGWTVSGTVRVNSNTLTISNNSTVGSLIISGGTFTLNSAGITISANGSWLYNSGTFNNSGTVANDIVTFKDNTIIGGVLATTFYKLTINTTTTTNTVTLARSGMVIANGGTLTLTSGIFRVGIGNTWQLGPTSAASISAVGGATSNFASSDNGFTDADGGTMTTGNYGSGSFNITVNVGNLLRFYNVTIGTSVGNGNSTATVTNAGTVLIKGTLVIQDNNMNWGTNAPIYGPNSTLYIYYTDQTFGGGKNYWLGGVSSGIGTTPGYPNNVVFLSRSTSNSSFAATLALNGTLTLGDAGINGYADLSGITSPFRCGGIYVTSSGRLIMPSSGKTLNTTGNFTVDNGSTFTHNSGTVAFLGTSAQTIGGTASSITFNNVTVNNSTGVTLATSINVPGTLTLTSGVLTTSTTNRLNITNTATNAISGTGSSTNMISGPVYKSVLASGTNSYAFPIGKGSTYLPLTLSSTNTTASNIVTVEAFTGNAGGTAGSGVANLSTTEYWSVSSSAGLGTTGSTVTITRPSGSGSTLIAKSTSAAGTYTSAGPSATALTGTTTDIGTVSPWTFLFAETPAPVVALANNGTQVVDGNLGTNSDNNVLFKFQTGVTVTNATLTAVNFTTTGDADGTDIENFQLYYTTSNTFATTNLLKTITTSLAAGPHSFSSLSVPPLITAGNTGYFWITAKIKPGAVSNHTVAVSAITTGDLTFTPTPSYSGTTTAGGVQTIIILPTVTTTAATNITTTTATINGTVNANNGPTATNTFDWGVVTGATPTTNPTATGGSNTSVALDLTGLTPNTVYTFLLKSNNGNPGSPISGTPSLNFTTVSSAPVVGVGNAPTETGFTANWTAPGGTGTITSYTVEVDDNSDFSSITTTVTGVTGTSTPISGLAPHTTYYFRVKAINAGGTSAWSANGSALTNYQYTTDTDAGANCTPYSDVAAYSTIYSVGRSKYLWDDNSSRPRWDSGSAVLNSARWIVEDGSNGNKRYKNLATNRYMTMANDCYYGDGANNNAPSFTTSTSDGLREFQLINLSGTQYRIGARYSAGWQTPNNNSTHYFWSNGATNCGTNIIYAREQNATTAHFLFDIQNIPAAIYPDLNVTGVTVGPEFVLGNAVTGTIQLKNNGNAAISNSTNIRIRLAYNGQYFFYNYTGGIAANTATAIDVPFSFTPLYDSEGSKTLTVTVNSNYAINEGACGNNSFTSSGIVVAPYSSVPTAITTAATAVTNSTATLNGTVNAKGFSTTVTFNWGTTISYGNAQAAVESPLTGSTAQSVTRPISGLTANTLYHFMVNATSGEGSNDGLDLTFTTLPNAPTIGGATSLTGVGFIANWSHAVVQGPVSFTYTVEVDDDINFGSINASQTSISSSSTASAAFTTLSPLTTYYFRVKAVNTTGSSAYSATGTVTTAFSVGSACSGTAIIVDAPAAPNTSTDIVLSEWSKAPANNISSTIGGTIQTGSTWQAMFDATNLYVLVKVKDANRSNVGNAIYHQDGVEIFVDPNNTKTACCGYTTNPTQSQTRIVWRTTDGVGSIDGINAITAGGSYVKTDATNNFYYVAIKLPFASMGTGVNAITNGRQIGFDVNINDQQNATGDREATAGWNGTNADDYQNPAGFGTATLTVCTPPVISSPVATNRTTTSASLGGTVTTINGGTLTTNGSGTVYSTASGVTTENTLNGITPTLNVAFSHTRSGLSPQTLYYFKAFATRTNISTNVTGISAENSFRTLSNEPAHTANLTATPVSGSQINLSWDAATFGDGTNAVGYVILRQSGITAPGTTGIVDGGDHTGFTSPANTTYIATVTSGTTYNDNTGLSAGTQYSYTVIAYGYDNANVDTRNYLLTGATNTATAATQVTITASAGANGSISPNGATLVNYNSSQAFTITPANSCYQRATVLIDGVNNPAAVTSGTYTFTNVTTAHTIAATFSLKTFTISVTQNANGTISPSSSSVNCGANKTFTITPDAGYHILDIIVDGSSVGTSSPYTFTNVTAAHSITATFEADCTGFTWVGTGVDPSDFYADDNWQCGIAPTPGDPVAMAVEVGATSPIAGDIEITDLVLPEGASLDLNGHTLTITGSLSGDGTFVGSPTSELVFSGSGGPINFADGADMLHAITINSDVDLGHTLNIVNAGTVTVNAGANLNTNGLLTLTSSEDGTARVAPSEGQINGDVTVERYTAQNAYRGWRMLAVQTQSTQSVYESWQESGVNNNGYGTLVTSPSGAAGYDATTPSWSLLSYVPGPTPAWSGATAATTGLPILNNDRAWMIYIRGDRTVGVSATDIVTNSSAKLRTTGPLFQGDQFIDLVDGFNLVGNPFASEIDFDNIEVVSGSIDNTLQLWDPTIEGLYKLGSFVYFNGGIRNGAPIGSYGAFNTKIQSGMAFIVKSNGASQIRIGEDAKSNGANVNGTGFRPQGGTSVFVTSLSPIVNNNPVYADGVTAAYSSNFNSDIDANDAVKTSNFGESIGMLRNTKLLAIERRQAITDKDSIFYKLSGLKTAKYRLAFAPTSMDALGLTAFLEDKYLSTSKAIDLSTTTYVDFDAVSNNTATFADRFRIVFKAAGTTPVTITNLNATQKNTAMQVDWKVPVENGVKQYEVERSSNGINFTKVGIVPATTNNGGSVVYSFMDVAPVAGVNYYRIKTIDISGTVRFTYIVKVTYGQSAPSITLNSTFILDGRFSIQLNNEIKGRYGVRLLNTVGQELMKEMIQHNGGSGTQTFTVPALLSKGLYHLEIVRPNGSRQVEKLLVN